jgi:RNase P subunit RPR2
VIEYLIALGCMIVVMLLSWVWIIVSSLLKRIIRKTRLRTRNRLVRLVCSCPKCHSNLYHDVKAELDQNTYASAFTEIKVVCDGCQTESIWVPLGHPPELMRYRPRGARKYLVARGGSAGTNRYSA